MPSNYPFPSVAALALSMMISGKTVDRLAKVTEIQPWEICKIAGWDASQSNPHKGTFCGMPAIASEYL